MVSFLRKNKLVVAILAVGVIGIYVGDRGLLQSASDKKKAQLLSVEEKPLVEKTVDFASSDNDAMYGNLLDDIGTLTNQVAILSDKLEALEQRSEQGLGEQRAQDQIVEKGKKEIVLSEQLLDKGHDPVQEMTVQMRAIENNFLSQDYDPAWSMEAESRLQQVFATSLTSHVMQSVECKTSLCRLEVASLDGELGGFHRELRDQISDILPAGAMIPNGNTVTVFLAKNPDQLSINMSGVIH